MAAVVGSNTLPVAVGASQNFSVRDDDVVTKTPTMRAAPSGVIAPDAERFVTWVAGNDIYVPCVADQKP